MRQLADTPIGITKNKSITRASENKCKSSIYENTVFI